MATKATACDLGSHSAKALVASAGKHGVKVLRFAAVQRLIKGRTSQGMTD